MIWNNEEGVRFAPVTMGSAVYGGLLPLQAVLDSKDQDGCTVSDALAAFRTSSPPLGHVDLGARFAAYIEAAELAHSLGLGVNAGHDLDLDNLTIFRDLPHLDEVSIGHAIMSRALFVGLERVVREYLTVLSGHHPARGSDPL